MIERPLRIRQTAITNAGTAVNVSTPKLLPCQLMYVEFVSLVNSSGETVKVAFGLTDMSGFTQLAAIISPANGDAAGLAVNWNLAEGDQLTAQVTGTADKGQVELIAHGVFMTDVSPVFDVVPT